VELTLFLSSKVPLAEGPAVRRVVRLQLRGFSRRVGLNDLKALAEAARGYRACLREMRENPPRVAVSFGGYAGLPGALAALRLGTPLVIHEQNVVPGLANRLLAPLARLVAVSFEETLQLNPAWRRKAVVTGNPLMRRGGGEEDPYAAFGLQPGRKTVAVIGGSQGAASLNRAVVEALPLCREREDLQIVHAVGRDKFQEHRERVSGLDTGKVIYRALDYVQRMDLLYRAADLVVSRAGASTVAELAAEGKAAILVPYPYATAAHQDANAAVLQKAGAALVIPDRELDGRRLWSEVERLLEDEERLRRMAEAARGLGKPDAAARLAEAVLSLAEVGS